MLLAYKFPVLTKVEEIQQILKSIIIFPELSKFATG